MNANNALKINDAVAHAIQCGESRWEIVAQVHRAADTALRERKLAEIQQRLDELADGDSNDEEIDYLRDVVSEVIGA